MLRTLQFGGIMCLGELALSSGPGGWIMIGLSHPWRFQTLYQRLVWVSTYTSQPNIWSIGRERKPDLGLLGKDFIAIEKSHRIKKALFFGWCVSKRPLLQPFGDDGRHSNVLRMQSTGTAGTWVLMASSRPWTKLTKWNVPLLPDFCSVDLNIRKYRMRVPWGRRLGFTHLGRSCLLTKLQTSKSGTLCPVS